MSYCPTITLYYNKSLLIKHCRGGGYNHCEDTPQMQGHGIIGRETLRACRELMQLHSESGPVICQTKLLKSKGVNGTLGTKNKVLEAVSVLKESFGFEITSTTIDRRTFYTRPTIPSHHGDDDDATTSAYSKFIASLSTLGLRIQQYKDALSKTHHKYIIMMGMALCRSKTDVLVLVMNLIILLFRFL